MHVLHETLPMQGVPEAYLRAPRITDIGLLKGVVQENPEMRQEFVWARDDRLLLANTLNMLSAIDAGDAMAYRIMVGDGPGATLAGSVGLYRKDHEDMSTCWSMTYWVAPSHRRQGLARRSAAALLTHAQELYKPSRVDFYIEERNVASQSVARLLGAQPTDEVEKSASSAQEPTAFRRWEIAYA